MIPKELGPWRVGKELGKGEFSSVYECTLKNGSQDQVVWAMKLAPFAPPPLKSKEKKDQTCCRLLGWENQIYSLHLKNATASFPRRPELASYGANEKGWRYLVIERFEGGTLKDRMSKNEISSAVAYSAAIRILMALRHLHSRQFLFRDLKPENVMTFASPEQDLEGRGVILVDFGACTKFVDSKGDHFTDGGSPVGTPLFMSINVHSMGPPTRRDDLESLGYLLGWMLNRGQLPWSSCKSEAEISNAKRNVNIINKMCSISRELGLYMEKVYELELEETPDYEMLMRILEKAGGTTKGPISFKASFSSSANPKIGRGRNSRSSLSPSSSNAKLASSSKKQSASRKLVELEDEDKEEEDDDVIVVKKNNTKGGGGSRQKKMSSTQSNNNSKKKKKKKDEEDEAYEDQLEEDEDDMEIEVVMPKSKRTVSRSSNTRLTQKRKKTNEEDEAYEDEEADDDDQDDEDELLIIRNNKQSSTITKKKRVGSNSSPTATTRGRMSRSNSKQKSSMDVVEEDEKVPSKQRASLIARATEKARQADQTTTTTNKRTRRSLSSDGDETTSRRRSSSSSSRGEGRRGSQSGSNSLDEEKEVTNRIQPMRTAKEMLVKAGVFLSAAAILYSGSYVQNNMN